MRRAGIAEERFVTPTRRNPTKKEKEAEEQKKVVSSTRRGRHLIGNGFPLDRILGEECAVGHESPHLRRPPLQLQARPGMCGDTTCRSLVDEEQGLMFSEGAYA